MQCGVLPLCPESIMMGDVSYYSEYSGLLDDQEKKDKLTRALGPNNKVRSTGTLTVEILETRFGYFKCTYGLTH